MSKEDISEYRQMEIDFVVNKGDSRYYIQSAYGIPDKKSVNRRQDPLKKLGIPSGRLSLSERTSVRGRTETE